MQYNRERAAEYVLALMRLSLHDGCRAWKGYDWSVLDDLHERGLIFDPRSKAKSVVLTEAGLAQCEQAFAQHLGTTVGLALRRAPRDIRGLGLRGAAAGVSVWMRRSGTGRSLGPILVAPYLRFRMRVLAGVLGAVLGALALAAALVLARAKQIPAFAPPRWIGFGTWGVAIAFAARTAGEFRYVGLFRRVRGTPFARWDARPFTPLCALLAAGTAWLAAS